ncbi:MAG: hypothetical protein ACLSHR_01540 [Oscillospiraceae bacterium]
MSKFRTVVSVIIMIIAGFVGFIAGAFLNDAMGGAILFFNDIGYRLHNLYFG